MKITSLHLKFLAVAVMAIALAFAICGHPLTSYLPHDLVAGIGLAGMGMAGVFKNYALNVAPKQPNGKTVITLGCGPNAPTLDALILTCGGTNFDATKINSIVGKVNGEIVYEEASGTVHSARRAYMGKNVAANKVVINLNEPDAKSAIEQNLSSWPLSLMQKASFELAIDASTNADMTLDVLQVFRAPTQNPMIKKLKNIYQYFASAGKHYITLPVGNAGGKLVRVWVRETVAGNVTSLSLRSKNSIGIEGTRAEIQDDQKDWGLVPQAGQLVLDFIQDGNLSGWYDSSQLSDLTLMMQGAAACGYEVDLEYLDPIGRL